MAERSIEISILLFSFALTFSLYIDSTLSSSLSLSLYPRSALYKSHHKDYKSLTLSRLARDSARVDSITAKLDLIINGSNRPTDLNSEAIKIPVTSGLSQGSGEYFTLVGVGSPARQFYMAIDTGSDISWLQCKPCRNCYNQTGPIFDPVGSSSYRLVQCYSNLCSSLDGYASPCQKGNCQYKVKYTDGSHTEGDFATETVSFGASDSFNIKIGCGKDNEGIFEGAAGMIGLGRGSLSLPSQINATSFSYCLVDRDSSLTSTLEFNSAPPSDSVMVPMLYPRKNEKYFYYIDLTGISVNDRMLSIPPSIFKIDENGNGGVIVDSGTTVTRLPTEAYQTLRDSFVQMTKHLPLTNSDVDPYDTCYDLSSWKRRTGFPSNLHVPVVSFHFAGDKTLPLKLINVLVPVNSSKTKFCFAFAASKDQLSIIGNVQQQGTRVTYDLAKSHVGFSADKC